MAEGTRPPNRTGRTVLWFVLAYVIFGAANRFGLGSAVTSFLWQLFDDQDTQSAVARLSWVVSQFVTFTYAATLVTATLSAVVGTAARALARARARASFADPLDRIRTFVAARPRLSDALLAIPALLWTALSLRIFLPSSDASWDTTVAGLALPGIVAFFVQTVLARRGLRALVAPTLSAEEASGDVHADGFTFSAVAVTTETIGAVGGLAALSVVMVALAMGLPTPTLARSPLFGAALLGYLVLASGGALLFRRASRISVGLDGIHVSGSARERFISYREIDGARVSSNTIELYRGDHVVLRLQLHGEDAIRRTPLAARISAAIALAQAQRSEPAVSFVASASADALDRAAGGVSNYREAAPTREKLWQVVESPAVDAAGRKAAATALARGGSDAERSRLRVAADQCAEPSVRARIEELLEDHEEAEPAPALKVRRA